VHPAVRGAGRGADRALQRTRGGDQRGPRAGRGDHEGVPQARPPEAAVHVPGRRRRRRHRRAEARHPAAQCRAAEGQDLLPHAGHGHHTGARAREARREATAAAAARRPNRGGGCFGGEEAAPEERPYRRTGRRSGRRLLQRDQGSGRAGAGGGREGAAAGQREVPVGDHEGKGLHGEGPAAGARRRVAAAPGEHHRG